MRETDCKHNQRTRYTDGFHCEDCGSFFGKNSATYRRDALLDTLWMVLNNLDVTRTREDGVGLPDCVDLKNRIGIGVDHPNYEALIEEAEAMAAKYGATSDSATVLLR